MADEVKKQETPAQPEEKKPEAETLKPAEAPKEEAPGKPDHV
jgi:hypothetical protein